MFSGTGLCDELITRPEESYRLCCVVVCDLETSRMGAPYIYDISRLRVNIMINMSIKTISYFRWIFASLSPHRKWLHSRKFYIGFVVEKIPLRQILLRVLQISFIISPMLLIHILLPLRLHCLDSDNTVK